MSRSGKIIHSLRITYLHQVVVTAVGLWLTPFFLRHIGEEQYGLWLVATQILGYLTLVDLGVIAMVARDVAFCTGSTAPEERTARLESMLAQTARTVLLQWPVVAAIAYGLWSWTPDAWAPLRLPLAGVLGISVVLFPMRIMQQTLIGLQDLVFVGRLVLGTWVLSTITSIAAVLAGFGLWALVAGWAVTQGGSAILWWWRLRRTHGLRTFAGVRTATGSPLDPVKRGVWASLSQISSVLLAGTDLLIIGRVLGPLATVPFSITGKLVSVLAHQPHIVVHAALPALSEMRAQRDAERLSRAIGALTLAMLLVSGFVVCVVLAVNQGFVRWWVGSSRFGGEALSVMLLATMLVRHLAATYSYTLFTFGRERLLAVLAIADGLATVTAMIVGVWLLGPVGAPVGSLISGVCVNLTISLRELAKELGTTPLRVMAPITPWAVRFAPLAAGSWLLGHVLVPDRFWTLAATGVAVSVAYGAVMFTVVMNSSLGPFVHSRIPARAARALGAMGLLRLST